MSSGSGTYDLALVASEPMASGELEVSSGAFQVAAPAGLALEPSVARHHPTPG